MACTGLAYRRGLFGVAGLLIGSSVTAADPSAASTPEADNLGAALMQGAVYGQLRPRYEFVDQEGIDEDAQAFTLRTRLGYQTAGWNRFSAVLEFEDVRAFGDEAFNSSVNGHTRYPIVPDPESTEVNQVFIDYAGFADTRLRLGRQYILLDNERFIGPVGWRQNSVSMDAFSLNSAALPDTKAFYAYVDNVNRLFGENHPTQSDWDMNTHLVNLHYSGLRFADLVGYGYFLDFEDPASAALSSRTLGVRLDGTHALAHDLKLLYTAEYADQRDHADGRPGDADYYWLTLGLEFKGLAVKLNQERLGGDGGYSFSTPLATVHAHNGWADKFLTTPVDGLVDTSVDLGGSTGAFKLAVVFHDFRSDHADYAYGREWDLLAIRPINKHLKLLAKYADYSADRNLTNLARNAALGSDVQKFWLMADFTF